MNKLFTILFFLLAATILLIADDGFTIKSYDVEVILLENGEIKVEEQITVEFFEKRRGIYRNIPIVYQTDKKQRIDIDDIQVRKWKYKVSTKGNNKEIRIGDANSYLTGQQEYHISYKVNGAIAYYDDHDEFFWNIIAPEWEVNMSNVHYSVRFPYGWKNKITNRATMMGYANSTAQMSIDTLEENVISSIGPISLEPKMGISVAFIIPKGLLPERVGNNSRESTSHSRYQEDRSHDWMSIIPAGILALLFGQWRKNGQRIKDPSAVPPQYYPPEGMSPAQVGTFYDYRVNRRDIIALLPYWGEKGYLRMKHVEDDLYFEKIVDIPQDEPTYAQELFNALFANADNTLLSSFKDRMYGTMASVAIKIMKEVKDKELYDKTALKTYHSGWMIGAFILSVIAGICSFIFLQSIFIGLAFILLGVFCLVIHFFQPKLSNKGFITHQHLRGLYSFLKEPDPAKMDELVSENQSYINQLFPYALAFGLDKEWESLFEKREQYAPDWYLYDTAVYSGSRPTFSTFSKDLGVRNIEKVFYSAPAPSGGSSGGGFSGGGSVGGGFGGGGGGSW